MAGRLSPEDAALWHQVAAGIEPLNKQERVPPAAPADLPADPPSETEAAPATAGPRTVRPARARAEPPPTAPTATDRHDRGRVPGLDRRTALRLRRGQLPIDARLDLHGLHQAAAHAALSRFLAESAALGRRCVLVITGRGTRAAGPASAEVRESGVLRRQLPHWLRSGGNAAIVLAHTPARPQHGGTGATYILLRRRRG